MVDSVQEVAMSRSANADELTVKVNYVRDWLNKAEDAIRRGDNIDAVTKLALAKADTTNLITQLIPSSRELRGVQTAKARAFTVRKLAMYVAPLILAGIFLLGMATSGAMNSGNNEPNINTPAITALRSIDRTTPSSTIAPFVVPAIVVENVEPAPVTDENPERTVVANNPPTSRPVRATPSPPKDDPVETPSKPVVVTADVPETGDDSIDLFDLGLDVIRSARENMGR